MFAGNTEFDTTHYQCLVRVMRNPYLGIHWSRGPESITHSTLVYQQGNNSLDYLVDAEASSADMIYYDEKNIQ